MLNIKFFHIPLEPSSMAGLESVSFAEKSPDPLLTGPVEGMNQFQFALLSLILYPP